MCCVAFLSAISTVSGSSDGGGVKQGDQNSETKAPCYLFISGEYQAARFSGNKPRKTKEITKLSPQLSPSLAARSKYIRISGAQSSIQMSLLSGQQAEPAVTTKEYINHVIMNVICLHTPKYTLLRTHSLTDARLVVRREALTRTG